MYKSQIYFYDVSVSLPWAAGGTPAIRSATDTVTTTKVIITNETKIKLGIEHNVRLFWLYILT